eukprot:CAMPEP_0174854176 /NCGR_PEP_ID=MMETSP1114-20130205/30262_1 /TAXON_ID=312471 /ORGANISM="Neobodo designis, Strain CCAP 1951/1" /LENGTH=92 /DNA_ID=CAMNT_0016088855 /DNA_START=224 /DNA_END=502 /DNA_ORIENTATION=+
MRRPPMFYASFLFSVFSSARRFAFSSKPLTQQLAALPRDTRVPGLANVAAFAPEFPMPPPAVDHHAHVRCPFPHEDTSCKHGHSASAARAGD